MRTLITLLSTVSLLVTTGYAQQTTYRQAALEAAKWIRASAIQSDHSTVWPSDPVDPKSVNDSLYSGTPGIVLFFLEASRSVDPSFLKDARAGADHLIDAFKDEKEAGLYTGISGIAFALIEIFKITGDDKYREA